MPHASDADRSAATLLEEKASTAKELAGRARVRAESSQRHATDLAAKVTEATTKVATD